MTATEGRTFMATKRISALRSQTDLGEPSPSELMAIDAEWPLIAAELSVVDAEAAIAAAGSAVTDLERRRLRRANRRVLAVAALLASGARVGGEAA
jgi:hypothetical protein